MTHNIPPLTIDDLLQATGKRRRNMQEIVRQYTAITGREVMRFPKRNYLELRFTPLYGKLDARIERLQASLDASSGVAGGLPEQPQGATKKRKTSTRSERTTRARPEGERA